ncbi:MAG: tetratricopeptide repeat protein [Bdellovibrionota bacterium]
MLIFSAVFSSCLKTRAQLREDLNDDNNKDAPVKVQEVQQNGQYVLDEIKGEITKLNGRIADLERNQASPSAGAPTKEEIKKLETRIIELEQAQAKIIEELTKLRQTPVAHPDTSKQCDKGAKQFASSDYDGAVESLSACLKNPKNKTVAEKSTFLLAESYYKLKEYKKAILDYSKLTEKYGSSSYVPTALYKMGLSFEALGMKDDAKPFYQELAAKFPKSKEAQQVKTKLK